MKKIIFTLCALSIGLVEGTSQNITYKIGSEYEPTLKHKDYGYYLANNNTAVNVSFFRENDYSIQPIDLNTLNVSSGYIHDISSLGEDIVFEKTLNLKDNLFSIYSSFDKKTKTRSVTARLIDDKNITVANYSAVLFESKDPKVIFLEPMKGTRYNFVTSANKEYALFICFYENKERNPKTKEIGFCVFDKNLNVKLSKVVEMPPFSSDQISSYHVDSKGNLFLFASNNIKKDDGTWERNGYQLLKINADGTIEKKEFSSNGLFLNDAILTDDLNGNLVSTGYYQKESKGVNGIYVYRFGTAGDGKVDGSGLKLYEFNVDLFKSYESAQSQENIDNTGRLDAKLYFDDIFFHPNGDIVITTEQYKSDDTPNSVTLGAKNYYLDIITLKINKDGKLVWMKKIPKNQTGSGRSDLSYKYHYNNGNDYFIFIDNEKKLNLTPNQAPATHVCRQGGYLVAVKIDAQGNTQKIPIFDLRNEVVSVFPFDLFKVNESTLIGKCLRDRKKTVIELNFK